MRDTSAANAMRFLPTGSIHISFGTYLIVARVVVVWFQWQGQGQAARSQILRLKYLLTIRLVYPFASYF